MALAALYFALGAPAPSELFAMAHGGGQRITPGFIGVAEFGRWRVICVPGPASLDGLDASTAPRPPPNVKPSSGNACRINQEMPPSAERPEGPPSPSQVIVAGQLVLRR